MTEKAELDRLYSNILSGNIEQDREIMSQDIVHPSAMGTIEGMKPLRALSQGFGRRFPPCALTYAK